MSGFFPIGVIAGPLNVVSDFSVNTNKFTVTASTGALTGASTAVFSATGATDGGVVVRSGNAAQRTALALGRTGNDSYIAVVGNANEYISGTAAGDIVVTNATTTAPVWVGNAADATGIKVAGGDVTFRPSASVTPGTNGDLMIQKTSNTSLTFKLKGSDGTVRSGSVTLA